MGMPMAGGTRVPGSGLVHLVQRISGDLGAIERFVAVGAGRRRSRNPAGAGGFSSPPEPRVMVMGCSAPVSGCFVGMYDWAGKRGGTGTWDEFRLIPYLIS